MGRSTAAALLAALVVSGSALATADAPRPYLGSWQARLSRAQMINEGYDARLAGTFRLVLARNGTYRTFNALDGWSRGTFKASGRRLVLANDVGCEQGGANERGVYVWSIALGRLRLTASSDPCGGRWQTLTYPLWKRR